MIYRKITNSEFSALWELHTAYKAEIGEYSPTENDCNKLQTAIKDGSILFFGAFVDDRLVGCCSVTVGFSTFNYEKSGVFEDFYILPEYRRRGIARELVRFAFENSGVCSMIVGCADCDIAMYNALGFSVRLGNMLAYEY